MSAGEQGLTPLWRDIESVLAWARIARPLQRADPLLDLDRLKECAELSLLERLARAIEGWDGRLILSVTDDSHAPAIHVGDRLVVDTAIEGRDGSLVIVFTEGALITRRLLVRDGQHWLAAGKHAPLALGPLVAILGVVVELRRDLPPRAPQHAAAWADAPPVPSVPP